MVVFYTDPTTSLCMTILFENALYRFLLLHEKVPVIRFDWTEKTRDMDYEDFQESCHNYAGFAWQYQAKHLLVDTSHFYFQLPTEFLHWREEQLNPRYDQLGVRKFAYIARPEIIGLMKDIPGDEHRFETRNFISGETALQWLNETP
jgi:hypothetical protein